jgi:hypothetical protein
MDLAIADILSVPQAVAKPQCSAQQIGQDLHIAVPVGAEAGVRLQDVLVNQRLMSPSFGDLAER